MPTVKDIIMKLQSKARTDQLAGMARYGMRVENRFGISIPELRKLGKEIGKNHVLAIKLWRTGNAEAQILAGLIAEPEKLSEQEMDGMVEDIDSWDIDDQTNMNLFENSRFAWKKIFDWGKRDEEFVKRTSLSLIACLAWHSKTASDEQFLQVFPVIATAAQDERKSIQKATSWALRTIGKRNLALNKQAVELARKIQETNTKPARWVASDVIRELTGEQVQDRLREQKLKSSSKNIADNAKLKKRGNEE
jgi:3-methyladenine DNA glycosylase AlkD